MLSKTLEEGIYQNLTSFLLHLKGLYSNKVGPHML